MLGLSRTIPSDEDGRREWLRQLYDEVERLSNNVQGQTFQQTVTDTATNIKYTANQGTALLLISGIDNTAPCLACTVAKATEGVNGSVVDHAFQAGSGSWGGVNLSVTAAATGFDIAHNGAATLSGEFIITIINTRAS
jgi:hypothetical protein